METTDLLCNDLPTNPDPGIGTVLVTGASGYIGGRLVPELLARGYRVRIMVRTESHGYEKLWPGVEVAVAEALDPGSLDRALEGVDTAYYLIHSMLLGPADFARADTHAARNFVKSADNNNLRRIIYLGGLGDVRGSLSEHLRSRIEVADVLGEGRVPVTILRAAIIIGSGSASYEIIKNLVMKVPILPVPFWAKNRCQPIAIRDVIKYLVGMLEIPESAGRTFDIGGREILTYERMMRIVAEVLQRKKLFVPFPLSSLRLFSYLVSLFTPVPHPITRSLMEGLRYDVICQDDSVRDYLSFEPLSYREAIVRAMSREEQDRVHTRWSDAYPPAHELAMKLDELGREPRHTARYSISTDRSRDSLFRSICRIGGREGWFHGNWMWRVRGAADRAMHGVGTSRGRRHSRILAINDVVDFWRVEDIRDGERLLLRAEMKLPGKAWLEFEVGGGEEERRLTVKAYYHATSLFGRLYWYIFLPFHNFIFRGLLLQIEKRS